MAMQMAPWLGGDIDMRYRRVACTPPDNIVINIDENSCSNGWLRLHVEVAIVFKRQIMRWKQLTATHSSKFMLVL